MPSQLIDSPAPTSKNPSIVPDATKQKPAQEPAKPAKMSAQDAVAKAFDDAGVKDADESEEREPAKAKEEPVKPETDVKPAKAEKSEPEKAVAGNEREQPRKVEGQSEGRKIIEAPARFLPRAKELWQNVPHPVREEWARAEQERDAEIAQYREHKAFREEVKEFEELARSRNVSFKQALTNYVDIERKFSEDPAQGFRQLCQNMGMTPPQAIGHILRSANVTPQQLIEHMQRAPHEYTALAAPRQMPQANAPQPHAAQVDPQVKVLEERLARMEAERVQNDVIRPFADEYPEYYSHEDQIAKVLQSGIIEQVHGTGLSPRDKLEAALFMVAPHVVKRSSTAASAQSLDSVLPQTRDITPAVDLRGTKSIKGAPHGVQTDRRGKMSKDAAIEEAMARFGA